MSNSKLEEIGFKYSLDFAMGDVMEALRKAHALGYAEGVEESAKAVETSDHGHVWVGEAIPAILAKKIRALHRGPNV